MEWVKLISKYKEMQERYGAKGFDPIISGGCNTSPKVCFVFMNPTGRNVASDPSWKGLKSPWIGTKNIWKLFRQAQILDKEIFNETKEKANDWDYEFSERVYKDISDKFVYITNLAKCTQEDARPLPNSVFKEYRDLLLEELNLIKPKCIVTLGNQVSSIILQQNIKVSECRRKEFTLINYKVFPVYYPVGQGMRNLNLAAEDIEWIYKEAQK
jgi:DNA polymerase